MLAEIDALRNSALASSGYLGATFAGVDADTRRNLTLTLSSLSDIGSSFILSKTAISPVFGRTTAVVENGGANTGSSNTAQGAAASRINLRTGDENITGSGLEYAWKKHGGAWGDNKSAFTISKDELKVILQDPLVVSTTAYKSATSGNYVRTVDMSRPIGIDAKIGGQPTNFLTVITDSKGNLVNTFPGKTF